MLRRQFLTSLAVSTLYCSSFAKWLPRQAGRGRYLVFGFRENGQGRLGRFDIESRQFKSLKTEPAKKVHEFFPVTNQGVTLFGTDKRGRSLLEIDILNMAIKARYSLAKGFLYGHGVATDSGQSLWLTSYSPNYRGKLVKFDLHRKQFVKEVDLSGYYPHQAHPLSGDLLIVGQIENFEKQRSQLVQFDLRKEKVVSRHTFSSGDIGVVDHFCLTETGVLVAPLTKIMTSPAGFKQYLEAPIYQWKLNSKTGDFIESPTSFSGQSLVDTVHPFGKDQVLFTNSLNKTLSLFDTKKRKFEGTLQFENAPSGINMVEGKAFVNTNNFELHEVHLQKGRLIRARRTTMIATKPGHEYGIEAHAFIV